MGLRAQVRTRDGWAVQHAVVTLTDTGGNQVLRATADPDGVVTASETLAPGPYTVVVTAVGYTPSAATALVTASGRADVGTVVLARQGGFELPPPGSWSIDPAHSAVSVVAQHLGIASVHGRFNEFGGTIEVVEGGAAGGGEYTASHVNAVIGAASVDTGNALRDKHLKSPDFLDVETFPEITFRSTGLTPAGTDRWTVHGKLALHGIERDVDLALSYLGTGADPWGGVRAAFHATTELHREDFQMNYNQVLQAGIAMVGAVLRVELHIEAVQGELPPMP
ncbi:YceI family protein [Streptomyces sp. 8L]|uniref:YceI family protein n=1 Tax=Streptomyces sp. 8L TaxID=2877242 RepID=UPI001CD72373|nr:YceI family protein [Streptomyces sp. 8L]MCA1223760.1 YceI family protein [Streptomyces sp. 8L]